MLFKLLKILRILDIGIPVFYLLQQSIYYKTCKIPPNYSNIVFGKMVVIYTIAEYNNRVHYIKWQFNFWNKITLATLVLKENPKGATFAVY